MRADTGRYTESAAKVVFFARYEASSDGSSTIEPQHLLLAPARVAQPLFADPHEFTKAVRSAFPPYPKHHHDNQLPLGRAALRIFDKAATYATRKGSLHIEPEHLLQGIMAEGSWGSIVRPLAS